MYYQDFIKRTPLQFVLSAEITNSCFENNSQGRIQSYRLQYTPLAKLLAQFVIFHVK